MRRSAVSLPTAICLFVLILAAALPAVAADPRPIPPSMPELAQADPAKASYDVPGAVERQHECTLHAVDYTLRRVRPSVNEQSQHRLALFALDEALHYVDPDANKSEAVKSFLKRRLDVAAYEMERTKVEQGAVIWKLYNDAFVVRTKSVTVAFDVTRGFAPDPECEKLLGRIVNQCDALFISHDHGDHVDPWVIERFRSQGKPVKMPGDLERDGVTRHKVKLSSDRGLDVVIFPGYQSDLINDVSLVTTPEGMIFAHTGDLFKSNSTPTDIFEWIDRVKDKHKVDVLMLNVWVSNFQRVVEGFDPHLVMTGHENEMLHDLTHRKPYYMSFDRLKGVPNPGVVTAWGESYWYKGE